MVATTAVGTAKMSLTLDTSDYTIAVERAKQQQAGLGSIAQAEAAKMTAAQRQVIQSLDRQITRLGLTREQWLQYRVITQTTGDTQAALLRKIEQNTNAITRQGTEAKKTVNALNEYGLTGKQQTAALRQVPAQLTDIFVSLQGGQNPLTVAIQQGGQLKDVFGGIRPAAIALGNAVRGLITPYTLLAAVIGGAGYAYLSAEGRQNAFNRSLILTGQQSRVTAQDLSSVAAALDEVHGVTSREAASALAQVVANGRIVADQYALVTEAAVRMQDAVGTAIEETVNEYAEIARDPMSAILRFNEAEQFLTASIYERIRALQEAGDIEGAAALATETRANAQIERAEQVVESLGLVSGAWHDIKNATGEAWDGAVNYFDNLDREAKDATDTLGRLWAAFKSGGIGSVWGIQAALSPSPAVTPPPDDEAIVNSQAQRQLDSIISGNRTRAEQQELEIERIRNLGKAAGKSAEEVQKLVDASNAVYEASKPKDRGDSAARALANAQASAQLDAIKNQEELQRTALKNTTRVLEAEYAARRVTAEDYYARTRQLVQSDAAAQEQSLERQIAYLRSRDVAGKDSVNVSKQIVDLETKLAQVRAESATQLVILGIQEEAVAEKRRQGIDSYREALEVSNEAARQSVDAQIARITMGQREAEQQERLAEIMAEGAEKQRQLARELAETNDVGAYEQKLAALKDHMDDQVDIVMDGYARMREAEGDWLNGLNTGISDWLAATSNVASQINKVTTDALDDATGALTEFAVTGKSTVRGFLADIGEQLARFMMKQAVLQFISAFVPSANYDFAGDADYQAALAGPVYNAKGNVFAGSPSLSAYSRTVVDKPTPFYFARGAGVMGEDGPEGIFPLERGPDGKLGVKAMGATGGGPVMLSVNTTINSDGSASSTTTSEGDQANMYKSFTNDMANIAQREIQRARMPGGQLWKAGVR